MSTDQAQADAVRRHYEGAPAFVETLMEVRRRVDLLQGQALTAARTAAFDQFHIRGLVATAELAQFAGVRGSMRVLDAGCGLGGPSRYLAEAFGCHVDGVDLIPAYIELARHLAQRSPAAGRLSYEVADLTRLAAVDGSVDLVWTQHAMMNVRDRHAAYAGFHRVLAPAGRLACYDVVAADTRPQTHLPVPWASEPAGNHLLTARETLNAITGAGFDLVDWADLTRLALNWFSQPMAGDVEAIGLHSVLGSRFQAMAAQLFRNLREGRVGVVMGVFARRAA